MDFYPNDAGNQPPMSPLATILSGVGAGARGYLEGKRAQDQHQLLLEQLSEMSQRRGQQQQLFPYQLKQAQHPFEQVSPGLQDVLGRGNEMLGLGAGPQGMNYEDLGPYEQLMTAIAHMRAMQALAGSRETPAERETKLTQQQLQAQLTQARTEEQQAQQQYTGFLKTDPSKAQDAFVAWRRKVKARKGLEQQLGGYQKGATSRFGAVNAPGAPNPSAGLFGGALEGLGDDQPQPGMTGPYGGQ